MVNVWRSARRIVELESRVTVASAFRDGPIKMAASGLLDQVNLNR